ncbi:hypothetical protein QFC24_001736 [Naganishia onofrii]|uniref:Uncharacterized protein n=1 Tax=Naganishia onofrii TaxID=1851511 RepID=A0ACC2XTM1_9TREE|nr:hypothetical protein QFC24_001736 [Naganishia onofrii]
MESLTINDKEDDVAQLRFDPAYNNPSANVIFISSDGIGFRVEDYYLKAVSPVFKEKLCLPTKGGPIRLPETSTAIHVALNEITAAEEGTDHVEFATMVSAFELAKRFDMKGPMARIKEELHDYEEGPRMLALACQQDPIDRSLVRAAFSRFEDHMSMDKEIFLSCLSNQKKSKASPDPDNLTTEFLELLTVPGVIAFVKAMHECEIEGRYYWKCYDWARVPVAFIKHLNRLGR